MGHRAWVSGLALGCAIIAAGVAGFTSGQPGQPARGAGLIAGQAAGPPARYAASGDPEPHQVVVPDGYAVRLVAESLTAPVGAAVGPGGAVYVAESGAGTGTPPRVVRLTPARPEKRTTLADDFPAPLTGITFQDGKLYVAYAGGVDVLDPATGLHHPVLTKLPGLGDYPNGPPVFGPDGRLYFAVGSATNAGVVGQDNIDRGWVEAAPDFHDIPCRDVTLRGSNFTIPNPLTPEDPHDLVTTGAFRPLGKTTARLQTIPGAVPCTGSVLRVAPDGTDVELVAWGLRYPAGLAFGPDGGLYASMQGFEERGSRPIVGDADYLYQIEEGRWYGWPDFAGGRSVTEEEFQQPGQPAPPLLAEVPEQPPLPIATFPHGSGAAGLIFPPQAFGLRGEALVALSGAQQIVRVNPRTGTVLGFARNGEAGAGLQGAAATATATANATAPGPAPDAGNRPDRPAAPHLERPVALATSRQGAVYVVDFGRTRPDEAGLPSPVPGTGRLWVITRTGPPSQGAGLTVIQWQWALVGLTLAIAGARLVARE